MPTERSKRRIKRPLLGGVALLAIFLGTAWFFTSGVFHDWVRRQIIAMIDEDTGGKTSINRIDWSLSKLELVLHDVTISGREPSGEAPFAHAERLYLRARMVSLLSRRIRLQYVEADNPVLHLITYPDGTTNQPVPKTPRGGSSVQALFDLQLDRGEIRNGILFINNKAIPLDGSAEGLHAALNYVAGSHSFDGTVDVAKLDFRYPDMRPFSASSHAEFTLANNDLTVRSLALTSGASVLNGAGKLTNFADPHIDFSMDGKLDLVQIAAITRTPGIRSGVAHVSGNITYYAGQYRATGTTEVQGASYRAGSVNVPDVNARANFVGDKNGLQLNDVRGTALGGSFEGSAGLQAMLTGRGHLHEHTVEEHGTVQLRFRGLDIQKLERAMPREQRELHLSVRGSVSGTVAAHWTGTPDKAIAQINANVTPPAATSPGEVPVAAAVQATYDGSSGKLNIQQLQLSTPGSKIEANGALGTNGGALHLSLAISNFAELRSALADLGVDFIVPAEIHGPVSFTGTVSGTRADPQVNGHVVADNVEYLAEFTAAALLSTPQRPPATQPMRVHWDRISADLQYSSHAVSLRNATLQAGAARDVISGSATLVDGHLVPTSRIDLQANVENEDVRRLAALAGTTSPVQGLVSGSARLSGTARDPTGSGTFRITNVPLGERQATIASAFTLRDHQATFTNVDIARGPDHLAGTATLNVVTNAFSFEIHGGPIELASLPEVQSARVSLAGKLTFTIQGSGTTASPEFNGKAHVANLVVNGESLGDLNSQATTRAGVMQVSVTTTAPTAQLAIDGTVRLEGDLPANLTVKFPHLDFDPLLRAYMKNRVTGHSLAVGTATVSGPLKNLHLLTLDANVEQFSVAIEGFDLKNIAPARFRVANAVLTLDQFHIAGTNTDLTATGAIPLTGARNMDLNANGTIDLALIQTLNHNFTSAGKVLLNVRAEGTPARPVLTGRVDVQNANIAYVDLPNGLSEVNGTLLFDQNRLVVQKLTGQSGGGALTLGGYVAYSNGLSFAVTAHVQDMRLRYPPGVSTIANADLRWTGSGTASTVAGDLMLTRFNISPQFDFANYVTRAGQPLPQVEAINSPLNNIRLDVHAVSAPALQVSTSLAKVSGDIDLHIRGTLADPSILGRVNILHGTVYFNGTNYQVQRGDITFLNPTTIEPVLNLAFTTRIAGYDINLSLDGPVDRLHTTYRSDPPLPSTDIISLLAFRQCPTSATFTCSPSAVEQAENYSASASPSFTETASNQILGEALNATLSNRVQHLFGISRVKISPEVANTIGNPSARITVEQQVSNNVTVTYVTDVSQAEQQVIQVEYNINRNFSIVAVRDQFGVASFDVRIRRRKR